MANMKKDTTRRNFLKGAGAAVPGVVAVATGSGAAAKSEPAEADLSSQVMQDTEHTRAYLDSARF